MKIRITDPNGVHFGGKILPKDSEHDIEKGPHTNAWLRFNQAEVVKEKKPKEGDEPDSKKGKQGDGTDPKEKDPKK